jgi:hypothetical protein
MVADMPTAVLLSAVRARGSPFDRFRIFLATHARATDNRRGIESCSWSRAMHAIRTLAVFCLLVVVALASAAGGDKDKKKFEIPNDAIAGTIKFLDLKKATFTIELPKGKLRKFSVDDKTEFWGPKGGDRGTGAKGLEDECMAVGYEIKVVPAKDSKIAKDVYLPVKKSGK